MEAFYTKLICILLLSWIHTGHTQKGDTQKGPTQKGDTKKGDTKKLPEMEAPPELVGAVQALIHPDAKPSRSMIAIALHRQGPPSGVKAMMEYAPHLIDLARQHNVVPPGKNGTVERAALAQFVSQRAMNWVKMNGGPAKSGMFNPVEQEELKVTQSPPNASQPVAPIHTPPVIRQPASQTQPAPQTQPAWAQPAPQNQAASITGSAQVRAEPVHQSGLITVSGSFQHNANPNGARRQSWSWTIAGMPGTGAGPMIPSGTGFGPMRPSGTGFAPVRPSGTGFAPVRPSGTGFAPVRPSGTGFAPVRPSGTGFAPMRPSGTGFAPVRPSGTGFGPMRPRGQTQSQTQISAEGSANFQTEPRGQTRFNPTWPNTATGYGETTTTGIRQQNWGSAASF